jgi:hypothetical protein
LTAIGIWKNQSSHSVIVHTTHTERVQRHQNEQWLQLLAGAKAGGS